MNLFAAMLLLGALGLTQAQTTPPATTTPPPRPRFGPTPEQQAKTQADHRQLLETLKISSLRPGANGNPNAPDAANSDESKVGSYTLPDPLVFKDGKKVTSAAEWNRRRRAELFEEFDREVYGRVPKVTPKVTWEVTETTKEARGTVPVVSVIWMSTVTAGYALLSTCPTSFLVTTGTVPRVSLVVSVTSQVTLGVTFGTPP